jgi:hypothetical protein
MGYENSLKSQNIFSFQKCSRTTIFSFFKFSVFYCQSWAGYFQKVTPVDLALEWNELSAKSYLLPAILG